MQDRLLGCQDGEIDMSQTYAEKAESLHGSIPNHIGVGLASSSLKSIMCNAYKFNLLLNIFLYFDICGHIWSLYATSSTSSSMQHEEIVWSSPPKCCIHLKLGIVICDIIHDIILQTIPNQPCHPIATSGPLFL